MASFWNTKSVEKALFNYKMSQRYRFGLHNFAESKKNHEELMENMLEKDFVQSIKAPI